MWSFPTRFHEFETVASVTLVFLSSLFLWRGTGTRGTLVPVPLVPVPLFHSHLFTLFLFAGYIDVWLCVRTFVTLCIFVVGTVVPEPKMYAQRCKSAKSRGNLISITLRLLVFLISFSIILSLFLASYKCLISSVSSLSFAIYLHFL